VLSFWRQFQKGEMLQMSCNATIFSL